MPKTKIVTRTDLLALLAAYTKADSIRTDASLERFDTLTPSDAVLAKYQAARVAALAAHKAFLDGISALDIPA